MPLEPTPVHMVQPVAKPAKKGNMPTSWVLLHARAARKERILVTLAPLSPNMITRMIVPHALQDPSHHQQDLPVVTFVRVEHGVRQKQVAVLIVVPVSF